MKDKSAYDIFKTPETPEQVVVMLDLCLLLLKDADRKFDELFARCEENMSTCPSG